MHVLYSVHVLCVDLTQARFPRLTCEWVSNLDSILTHTNPVVHVPDLYYVRSKAILLRVVLLGAVSGRSTLDSLCSDSANLGLSCRDMYVCVS